MSKKRKTDAIVAPDVFENTRAKTLSFAEEAMREVYARLPWDQTFTLGPNQVEAKIVKFVEPQVRRGKTLCAFDVVWEGGHLEFVVEIQGWGGDVPKES